MNHPGIAKARPRPEYRPPFTGVEGRYIVRRPPSYDGFRIGDCELDSLDDAVFAAWCIGGDVYDKITHIVIPVTKEFSS